MNYDGSILETVREVVGLTSDNSEFDNELIPHINSAISTINQNGAGKTLMITNIDTKWKDLLDPKQNNDAFAQVVLFISLQTKVLFDPPPPSSVELYNKNIDELLWRVRVNYEGVGENIG